MAELLMAAQMRAIEAAAIASGEVTGLELMERAGRGVVEAILDWRRELATAPQRAVVLCGPGNNGGDGFVVARLLKERGWEVEVFLYGDAAKLPPDAKANCERWRDLGAIAPLSMPSPTSEEIAAVEVATRVTMTEPGPALIVDALFGTGLTRPIVPLGRLLSEAHLADPADADRPPFVAAVDIPSGLCADSGRIVGGPGAPAVGAHLTVAFHRPKLGHVLGEGPVRCGRLRTASIGIDGTSARSRKALAELHGLPSPGARLGRVVASALDRTGLHPGLGKGSGHKYAHGHALILSGGVGRGGAARLAARGALRIGAGLVTVGCPPAALIENAARLDAVMLAPVADAEALRAEMAARRIGAVCIGPGFGAGERLRAFVAAVLGGRAGTQPAGGGPGASDAAEGPAAVLDADALTEFREDPETLFAMLHGRSVLTPHEGEFGRLFPDILAKLRAPAERGPAYSKVDATREAAARAGCVVLFKGPDTVVADPEGRCSVNAAHYERAAPWLATAGSGDVLAGFVTGLLARGLDPMAAAATAAWLHVQCALKYGPGLIAEDLPEALPAVFRDLGL